LLRLTFITSCDLGEASGPAVHAINIANAVARLGASVTLVAARPDGPLAVALDPAVNANFVANPRRLRLPGAVVFLLAVPALYRSRQSVVHVRSAPGSSFVTWLARSFRPLRLTLELNGWLQDEAQFVRRARPFRHLIGYMQRRELFMADRIRVVTSGLARRVEQNGIPGERIRAISTGVDLSVFKPLDRAESRRALGLPVEGKRLVFVGNLWEAIDMDMVLAALDILRKSGRDVRLTIVGGGRRFGAIRADCERFGEAVTMTGWLPQSEAIRHIAAADIALAPFKNRHGDLTGLSPLKIRDYAAAGRRVVASDLPGVRQRNNPAWLRLANPGDARAFALAIAEGLDHGTPEEETEARAFAEAHFGWDWVARKMLTDLWDVQPHLLERRRAERPDA